VIPNPAAQFATNDKKRYPETVGITLTMQLVLFLVMYSQGKRGFDVMKRSEKEKRNALPEALPPRGRISKETQVAPSGLDTRTQRVDRNATRITEKKVTNIDKANQLRFQPLGLEDGKAGYPLLATGSRLFGLQWQDVGWSWG
jgi:hypothetical protein